MIEPPRPSQTTQSSRVRRPAIDGGLLARAAEINEAVAGEFAQKARSPWENPLIERMAELGVETDAAAAVAVERAHRIAFYMRRGRTAGDRTELNADARELTDDERAQVAALAVSWWDGVLTALRAHELEHRTQQP